MVLGRASDLWFVLGKWGLGSSRAGEGGGIVWRRGRSTLPKPGIPRPDGFSSAAEVRGAGLEAVDPEWGRAHGALLRPGGAEAGHQGGDGVMGPETEMNRKMELRL